MDYNFIRQYKHIKINLITIKASRKYLKNFNLIYKSRYYYYFMTVF